MSLARWLVKKGRNAKNIAKLTARNAADDISAADIPGKVRSAASKAKDAIDPDSALARVQSKRMGLDGMPTGKAGRGEKALEAASKAKAGAKKGGKWVSENRGKAAGAAGVGAGLAVGASAGSNDKKKKRPYLD